MKAWACIRDTPVPQHIFTPSLTPMVSGSDSPGGYSPGRRRVIALAGASGLAGVAAAIWPWKQDEEVAAPAVSKTAAPRIAETEEVAANEAAAETTVSNSSVASERERYAQHVGETFRGSPEGGGKLDLILETVGPLLVMAGGQKRFEGYSLLFKIPKGNLPGDGMVTLSHEALGESGLYFVSVGGPTVQARCEAIISRAV
ncbi:hypothetical protein OJ996_15020 [Luteolibacter sp. GHJ8]|uniref:DUF6916 domain-containing protein n=2 Tax=Luteolibacter rhizosphaerae TaxID=2989719 RepID=A0ABT3G506_9BACT|nr:hypothetical protein [Luteolibacter rhizosphaerae]